MLCGDVFLLFPNFPQGKFNVSILTKAGPPTVISPSSDKLRASLSQLYHPVPASSEFHHSLQQS